MKNGIESVLLVSDGILIGFRDGTTCYYSTAFLESQIGLGSNQVFLDHDPSDAVEHNAGQVQASPFASLPN